MSSSTQVSARAADGGAQAAAALAAWLAARQKDNAAVLTQYSIYLSVLIGIFIVAHWLRYTAVRLQWSRSAVLYPFVALSRAVRRMFIRRLPGFTSVGHAMVVTVFVALNATFSFYRIDVSQPTDLAARFGWMAAGNMALVVFLALKNTPLAFLTAYSYERLNGLHQIAGYTTLLYAILHGTIYPAYFIKAEQWEVLHLEIVNAGIVLGFATLSTVLAGTILRRLNYELFYIVHLVLFVVIVVALGLHRPSFEKFKILIVTVLIAAMWFADRLIRFGRLVYNSINNEAEIYALPNGGTRIVIKKHLFRARPGKHCYVWLPQIRAFETHPFTIVASDPLELIVNTYSGFTKDLHDYAARNSGRSLKVSVEGPYGTLPDPMDYDKVVLVAGGAGATFTFGLAADMLRRMTEDSRQQIDFIWAIREYNNLLWFTQHLNNLRMHSHAPRIALKVHLTKLTTTSPFSSTGSALSDTSSGHSPILPIQKNAEYPVISGPTSPVSPVSLDSEKNEIKEVYRQMEPTSATTSSSDLTLIHGRPDTEGLIRAAVRSVGKDQRILIAACGPNGLLDVVRNTTASCISVDGPAVELHCEQFGW
ncbi:Uu.00g104210.m01.CDS01 [Anthostomella pinea]|uniref:ferric-chelate reductase (NADPH) n=1 Tax=Anthostomella pinea TaxID=933095 RepID=A0AAI8YFN8_9PEZI|nr:Uu.00g104210.m01.CDS01 [Anthostomella pinea]